MRRQRTIIINDSQFIYLLDSLKEAVRNLEKIKTEWDSDENSESEGTGTK